jgi:surface antigen
MPENAVSKLRSIDERGFSMVNPKGRLRPLIQGTLASCIVGAATLGFEATLSVAVADPWKDESGHGKHGHWGHYNETHYEHKGGGPPPWAPAHGYRRKHSGHHPYYPRPQPAYPQAVDLGITSGTCNRRAVGAVLGGVVGGVAGAQIGRGDGKTAATIAGTLLGVLVGSHIGRSMDQADRYCTAQVLEQASDRQSIVWHNPEAQAQYRVTPLSTYTQQGQYCREYLTEAQVGNVPSQVYGRACRMPDGAWQITN